MASNKNGLSIDSWGGKIILLIIGGAIALIVNLLTPLTPILLLTDGDVSWMSREDIREFNDEIRELNEEVEELNYQIELLQYEKESCMEQFDELESLQDEIEAMNDNRIVDAETYLDANNYRAALQLLNAFTTPTAEVTILSERAALGYESQIVEQVDVLLLDRQTDDASTLIQDALDVLPDSQVFRDLLDDVEARRARSGPLSTLVPPHQGGEVVNTVTMGGTIYHNAIIYSGVWTASPGVSLHNLEGQFNILTGYAGRVDNNQSMFDAILYIYGDGELLGRYEVMAEELPVPISVNVEDVRLLRIEFEGLGSSWFAPDFAFVGSLD